MVNGEGMSTFEMLGSGILKSLHQFLTLPEASIEGEISVIFHIITREVQVSPFPGKLR